jgi:deoxyribodipyrimidine photo-lyase
MPDIRSTQPPILLWYGTDLRLHDHLAMHQALQQGKPILGLYCFDPRQFGETAFGFAKTGAFRAQFLRESVADLRQQWRALGSDLIVRWGLPETVIPQIHEAVGLDAVYYTCAATDEERQVEKAVAQALAIPCQGFWQHTLYAQAQLPFSIAELPELFTQFRHQVEAVASVEPPLPKPSKLPPLPADIEPGEIPTLAQLGLELPETNIDPMITFKGGESAGLARIQDYIWQQDCLRVYKDTRNGLLTANDSSKFSPWLALGCVSPRYIYKQVKQYEATRIKNDSTYWLIFELLWRDYFRWICLKHGNTLFRSGGIQNLAFPWRQDWERFAQWQAGMTGYPLVDAAMRELAATGFMSNRARQNVASFLTKNLGIDWRMGAEYFESMLIDYDVCSNWGNWNYAAGVGNDARGFRFFNITKQATTYDPQGDYVKYWCREPVGVTQRLQRSQNSSHSL